MRDKMISPDLSYSYNYTSDTKLRAAKGLKTQIFNTTIFKIIMEESKNDNDEKDNDLIVGGRNQIFRINSDKLEVTDWSINGPDLFNKNCKPIDKNCKSQVLTDHDNKVLLINKHTNPYPIIISCGTTKQGMCTLHYQVDLSKGGAFGDPREPANYLTSSINTIAFTAPLNRTASSFIFASEYDDRPLDFSPPVLSSRVMEVHPKPAFHLTFREGRHNSSLDIIRQRKLDYKMRFVYGFYHGNFAYILSNQPISMTSNANMEVRLGRVCLSDKEFKSYTEIPLECPPQNLDDSTYHFATAGYFGKVGEKDYKVFNSRDSDSKILYVSFMFVPPNRVDDVIIQRGSRVCGFDIGAIDKAFDSTIERCFEADNLRDKRRQPTLLNWVYGDDKHQCIRNQNWERAICGESANNVNIQGHVPLPGVAIMELPNSQITSLAVSSYEKNTYLVAGTSEGNFTKSLIDERNATTLFNEKLNIQLEKGLAYPDTEIRREPIISKKEDFIYFASGRQVTKFPLHSCSIYSSCSKCITTKDPLGCGWCPEDGRCGHPTECANGRRPVRDECSPVIFDFEPKKGPLKGGTIITIKGDNFGQAQDSVSNKSIKIKVIDVDCGVQEWKMEKILCKTGNKNEGRKGQIHVTVKHGGDGQNVKIAGTAISEHEFEYVDPSIESIFPNYGPQSGGVVVTLHGKNLDNGKKRYINFGQTPCTELFNNDTSLKCKLENTDTDSPWDNVVTLSMTVDNLKLVTKLNFTFKPIPSVFPLQKNGAIASGGNLVSVGGQHLSSIREPVMQVTFEQEGQESKVSNVTCLVQDDNVMVCEAPPCPYEIPRERRIDAKVKFLLGSDNESNPLRQPNNKLVYHRNVTLLPWGDNQGVDLKTPIVEIHGMDIYIDYNINITAGTYHFPCLIRPDSEYTKLKCELQLGKTQPNLGDFLTVYYQVGKEHQKILGTIEFVDKPSEDGVSIVFIVLISFLVLVLVLLCVGFSYFRYYNNKNEKSNRFQVVQFTPDRPHLAQLNHYDLNQEQEHLIGGATSRPQYVIDDETIALLTSDGKLIAREHVALGEMIGKGHFGIVFKATLYSSATDSYQEVAAKTLQQQGMMSSDDIRLFIDEALVMKDFNHPHVLHLIGVTFGSDGSPIVVLPYMANGDLNTYLRDDRNTPKVRNLIDFAIQIAKGMEYLASQKFVHRDLAARNCILDDQYRVKVADFGLYRGIYEKDYYRPQDKKLLPVKWMAPESLESNTFTVKSDVWSFGVVIWELMTRGYPPYNDVGNWDMVNYLRSGRRLLQPDSCPSGLYKIMLRCWEWDPDDRPPFSELVILIDHCVKRIEESARMRSVGRNVTYVNIPQSQQYYNPDLSAEEGNTTNLSIVSSSGVESSFHHLTTDSEATA